MTDMLLEVEAAIVERDQIEADLEVQMMERETIEVQMDNRNEQEESESFQYGINNSDTLDQTVPMGKEEIKQAEVQMQQIGLKQVDTVNNQLENVEHSDRVLKNVPLQVSCAEIQPVSQMQKKEKCYEAISQAFFSSAVEQEGNRNHIDHQVMQLQHRMSCGDDFLLLPMSQVCSLYPSSNESATNHISLFALSPHHNNLIYDYFQVFSGVESMREASALAEDGNCQKPTGILPNNNPKNAIRENDVDMRSLPLLPNAGRSEANKAAALPPGKEFTLQYWGVPESVYARPNSLEMFLMHII